MRAEAERRKNANPSMKDHPHSLLIPLDPFPLESWTSHKAEVTVLYKYPFQEGSFKSHIQVPCKTEQQLTLLEHVAPAPSQRENDKAQNMVCIYQRGSILQWELLGRFWVGIGGSDKGGSHKQCSEKFRHRSFNSLS